MIRLMDDLRHLGWTLQIARRRVNNRLWDVVGRAAGYCMADCWQPRGKTFSPGFPHWRCTVLRRDHASGWHRTGHYRWVYAQQPIYDPLPLSDRGRAPRWLQHRHYDVWPRRKQREAQINRFDVLRARRQAAAVAAARAVAEMAGKDSEALMAGLRRAVPVRPVDRLSWSRRPAADLDRHDVHVHRSKSDHMPDPDSYEDTVGELGTLPFTGPIGEDKA